MIAIGRINDDTDTLLDAIPFEDVETVHEMLGNDEPNIDNKKGNHLNAFMVTTIDGGHNSGRTYYFQATSAESYAELTRHLLSNAKEAKKRAQFKTRFAKSQYRMQKLFNSLIFQNFSALLIVVVSVANRFGILFAKTNVFCGLPLFPVLCCIRTFWPAYSRRSTGAKWFCRTAQQPS